MNTVEISRFRLHLVLGWLLAGGALALLALPALDSPTLGWSGVYWLLVAPLLLLMGPARLPQRARH